MDNRTKKIITARINVGANTPSAAPLIYRVTSQLPILEKIGVSCWLSGAGVNNLETGWKLISGGQVIIPAMGSVDVMTPENYVVGIINTTIRSEYSPFVELDGPPYAFEIHLYDIDAAIAAWYFFDFTFSDKIQLPAAPITNDIKKND